MDAATGAQYNLTPKTIDVRLELVVEGEMAADSGRNSSIAIKRLNDLDQMMETKQISEEEYTKARIALLKQYFPELVPEAEEVAIGEEAGDETAEDVEESSEEDAEEPVSPL